MVLEYNKIEHLNNVPVFFVLFVGNSDAQYKKCTKECSLTEILTIQLITELETSACSYNVYFSYISVKSFIVRNILQKCRKKK